MKEHEKASREYFRGLRALMESSFPRTCPNCGRHFKTAEEFLAETEDVRGPGTGLAESVGGDGNAIVEAFRNCRCGSTLVDFFGDRRDRSKDGVERRRIFGRLLDMVEREGLDREFARRELRKVARGAKSGVLAKLYSKGPVRGGSASEN